jgi:hypothetical protein
LVKHTKARKINIMTTKYTKWPLNIPTFSIPRPLKIYPNWDFWYEKMPSGNPAQSGRILMHNYYACTWF